MSFSLTGFPILLYSINLNILILPSWLGQKEIIPSTPVPFMSGRVAVHNRDHALRAPRRNRRRRVWAALRSATERAARRRTWDQRNCFGTTHMDDFVLSSSAHAACAGTACLSIGSITGKKRSRHDVQ